MDLKDIGVKRLDLRFDEDVYRDLLAVQGDTQTRGYEFMALSESGEAIDLPNLECRLFGVNSNYPDKTVYTIGEYLGNGKYRVMLSTDMVSKAGRLKLQVALYQGTTALIQSKTWEIEVTESLTNGGSLGTDLVVDFTRLAEAIVRVETLESDYTASLAEQSQIQSDVTTKHGEVTTMHTSLQGVFDTEASRVAAEQARVAAESERATAEQGRATAESGRVTAEATRETAEDTRATNEADRKIKEIERQTAESSRVTAESDRVTVEQGRVTAESARVSAESARESAEGTRETQEGTRQTQEQDRVAAEQARATTFASWELTMQGVIPDATETEAGAVKIRKTESESGTATVPTVGDVDTALVQKVDKVTGKGLSSNDYDNAAKAKVDAIPADPKYTDTTYNDATTSASGLMSSTDKSKLDGIAANANDYSLPTASTSTLGGVKVGDNLSISNGVLSGAYATATTSTAGLMSGVDKTKLDGLKPYITMTEAEYEALGAGYEQNVLYVLT